MLSTLLVPNVPVQKTKPLSIMSHYSDLPALQSAVLNELRNKHGCEGRALMDYLETLVQHVGVEMLDTEMAINIDNVIVNGRQPTSWICKNGIVVQLPVVESESANVAFVNEAMASILDGVTENSLHRNGWKLDGTRYGIVYGIDSPNGDTVDAVANSDVWSIAVQVLLCAARSRGIPV